MPRMQRRVQFQPAAFDSALPDIFVKEEDDAIAGNTYHTTVGTTVPMSGFMNANTTGVVSVVRVVVISDSIPSRVEERPVVAMKDIEVSRSLVVVHGRM